MNTPPRPTNLERAAGSLVVESSLTVLAAMTGGSLAPLLPVLAKSLAAERQRKRVEAALAEVNEVLQAHEAQLASLTDEQFKVINESILAMLLTTQAEKLTLLRNAVENAIVTADFSAQDAVLVSRVIRDISVYEAQFLARAFTHDGVQLTASAAGVPPDNVLRVDPDSAEALNVTGFVSLGLLSPPESSWDSIGIMRFTRIAAKVLALLKPDASPVI